MKFRRANFYFKDCLGPVKDLTLVEKEFEEGNIGMIGMYTTCYVTPRKKPYIIRNLFVLQR